jgi:serine/threonine protein kinase/tetratricopeptide (TPR) repeat protein
MNRSVDVRWQRAKEIHWDALAKRPADRDAFVDLACGDDAALREQVRGMLAHHFAAEADGFLQCAREASRAAPAETPRASLLTKSNLADHQDTAAQPPKVTGDIRGDRFEIKSELARGGLGIVYIAVDREIGREVALKEIQDSQLGNADAQARFLREAEITGRLEHPGIAPVYAIGEYGDGRPYYAMKLVRGESLAAAIERFHAGRDFRGLKFRRLLGHFVDICNTIEYAHSKNIVHRDVKPQNVHLGRFGETIVLDWGLAKAVSKASSRASSEADTLPLPVAPTALLPRDQVDPQTVHGLAFGTPSYMSPEQASGEVDRIGAASDIFSLGSTLYCLLTGRPPVTLQDHESIPDLLDRLRRGQWSRPREVQPSIPKPLDAICRKAMSLRPSDRYESAAAIAADIDRFLADEPTSVWRESLTDLLGRVQRRYRGLRTGLAVALVILLASVLGLTWLAVDLNSALTREKGLHDRADQADAEVFAQTVQRLAARGDWEQVLKNLSDLRLRKVEDPLQIELWRIEALNALHRSAEAIKQIESLANRSDLGKHRGEVVLWQADLLKLSDDKAEQLFRQAIESGQLPPEEMEYARAWLAETMPEAVNHLERALQIQPFHHRANVLMCINLISLGRLQESLDLARAAQFYFPADPSFAFIAGLCATFQGDERARSAQLTRIASLTSRAAGERAETLLTSIEATMQSFKSDNQSLGKLLLQLPTLAQRATAISSAGDTQLRIQLPRQLNQAFVKVVQANSLWTFSLTQKAAENMAQASAILPNAELLTFYGALLTEAGRTEEAIEVLGRAAAIPELIPGTHQSTFEWSIIANTHLFSKHGETERGQQVIKTILGHIDSYIAAGGPTPDKFGTVIYVLLKRGEAEHRLRAHHLLENARRSGRSVSNTQLAWSHQLQHNHQRALDFAEQALSENPNDAQARQIRDESLAALVQWQKGRDGAVSKPPAD